jgi:hypothetical protein
MRLNPVSKKGWGFYHSAGVGDEGIKKFSYGFIWKKIWNVVYSAEGKKDYRVLL